MVAVELSKVVVVVVNVIFMIFGLAVLIVGIVFKVGWDDVRDAFVDESANVDFNLQYAGDTLAYGAIIFGAFIVLVSFLGCAGGCCRVRVLLVIYAIIVLILLIGEVVVVALVASKGNQAEETVQNALKDTLSGYYENSTDPKSKAWSAVFSTFECCAVINYTDFKNITFYKDERRTAAEKDGIIPITCCRDFNYESALTEDIFQKHTLCLTNPTKDNAYLTGCETEIRARIEDNLGAVIGVGVTILVIEVVVVIIAFFLCCRQED